MAERLYTPLPRRFESVSNQLLKEYTLLLGSLPALWANKRAQKMVRARIEDVEHDYYTKMALHALASTPECKLAIINGENPLKAAKPPKRPPTLEEMEQARKELEGRPKITFGRVVEGAALGATVSHVFPVPFGQLFFPTAGGLLIPASEALKMLVRKGREHKRYPFLYLAKGLIRHEKPEGRELTNQQKKENYAHLKKQQAKVKKEYDQLHITLRMLDALHEMLRQPVTLEPRSWGEKVRNEAFKKMTGGRLLPFFCQAERAQTREKKGGAPKTVDKTAPATQQLDAWERYQRWLAMTKNLRDLLPHELNNPEEWKKMQATFPELAHTTPQEDWLKLQERLTKDETEYCKAFEIEMDLNEMDKIRSALETGHPQAIDLKERITTLERTYPKPDAARKQLRKFLEKAGGNIYKIQKRPKGEKPESAG